MVLKPALDFVVDFAVDVVVDADSLVVVEESSGAASTSIAGCHLIGLRLKIGQSGRMMSNASSVPPPITITVAMNVCK